MTYLKDEKCAREVPKTILSLDTLSFRQNVIERKVLLTLSSDHFS